MATPQLLNDIISVLLLLAPSAALLSLVIAGVSLRREGTMTFAIGGGFTKWMFWAIVFLTLQPLLSWFTSFGVPVPLPNGGIATGWLANLQSDVAQFVTNFVATYSCRSTRQSKSYDWCLDLAECSSAWR